jgi:hypothetical protein
MGRERRPINQLKKSYRKLANDTKVPPRIRLISTLCLAKLDNLLENDFLMLLGLTKQIMNPGNAVEDKTEPEVVANDEVDLDAILTRTKEVKNG